MIDIIYCVCCIGYMCQIYITCVSQKLLFFMNEVTEKSQLLTDPHDVNLTHNQCSIQINYHYTMIYMEKVLNGHFLDVFY